MREALLAHPRLSPADREALLERADDEDLAGWGVAVGLPHTIREAAQRILARRRVGG